MVSEHRPVHSILNPHQIVQESGVVTYMYYCADRTAKIGKKITEIYNSILHVLHCKFLHGGISY